jgi:deoxyadenosine/deoxycytidine kinase
LLGGKNVVRARLASITLRAVNQPQHKYIAIEGNIGAGKSTLATMLSRKFNTRIILEEFEDNSFLPKFYGDPKRYAFPLEMSFLTDRYNQLKNNTLSLDLFQQHTISDYMLAKCLLFAKVNLDEDEFELYRKLFEIIDAQLPKPELIVYLHNPIEKLQWNIANRGRSYEQKIKDAYLQQLQDAYLSYLQKQLCLQMPVLIIDCSGIDFVKSEDDFANLSTMICKEYKTGLHQVTWLHE